jgi:predicted ATPase
MLKRLRLHNFRTYLNAEAEFRQRQLIIGKNNSGKTNLCFAIRFLGASASSPLAEAVGACVPGGPPEFTHFAFKSNQATFEVVCDLPFDGQMLSFQYSLSIEITGTDSGSSPGEQGVRVAGERLLVTGERFNDACLLDSNGNEARLLHEEQVGREKEPHIEVTLAPKGATMLSNLYELQTNRRAILFRRFLRSWTYFSLSPDSIRWGWREAGRTGALYVDGKHVATSIFHMKNQDERRYRRLIERVAAFEEGLEAINFLVAPDQGVLPFVALNVRPRASWAGLSDGTLRALALSHLIEAADAARDIAGWPSPLTIIEEPENGIYAGLLRKLVEDFADCAPLAQFIFTSHSPYLIDLFDDEPSAVTLLRREGTRTVIHRLPPPDPTAPPDERMTLAEKYFAEVLE